MQKGDKVKFIHQKITGKIIRVISGNNLEIELEDGFVISASPNEVIAIDRDYDFMSDCDISHDKIRKSLQTKKTPKKALASKHSHAEIDLHIEKISKGHIGLSNTEIIKTQIARCQLELQKAIQRNQKELVLIHGVGKGVLRKEIQEILKGNKSVKEFYDINQKGATKVIFR